ncbi:hypothetical protein Cs7R123_65530 [Catellatospora sp. TT07R-123]|uniref:hypothetical protein n=1 Tax=Catellatospora sp. TT07R-123 TaxID=2733863 RepID=UPI001B1673BC|nr:hypothetical protein [Catellatospora sp. TT07R-123]GHJ49211.1 hypothetical protein Cs7R123_65530 [Catellatospora sp. TT07R-123]
MATVDPSAQLLDDLRHLREQARRRTHGGAWLPVALLAALLLASIALYRTPFAQVSWIPATDSWAGLPDAQRSATASYLFWFVGTPLVIALSAAWYRHRAQRVGVRLPLRWFVLTALGALAALAVLAAAPVPHPEDSQLLAERSSLLGGLATPLLPVSLALVALGWIERSRAVALAGAWVGLIAWWQSAMGMGHLTGFTAWVLGFFEGPALGGELTLFGLNRPGPTLILMALPLVVFAVVRALRTRGGSR